MGQRPNLAPVHILGKTLTLTATMCRWQHLQGDDFCQAVEYSKRQRDQTVEVQVSGGIDKSTR